MRKQNYLIGTRRHDKNGVLQNRIYCWFTRSRHCFQSHVEFIISDVCFEGDVYRLHLQSDIL